MPFKQSPSSGSNPVPEKPEQHEAAESASETPDVREAARKEGARATQYALGIFDHYGQSVTPEEFYSLQDGDSKLPGMPNKVRDALVQLASDVSFLRNIAESSDNMDQDLHYLLDSLLASANKDLKKLEQYFSGRLNQEPDFVHFVDFQPLTLNAQGEDPGIQSKLMTAFTAAVQKGKRYLRAAVAEAEQSSDDAAAEELLGELEDRPENVETASFVIEGKGKNGRPRIEVSSEVTPDMAPKETIAAGELLQKALAHVNDMKILLLLQPKEAEKSSASLSVEQVQRLKEYTDGLARLEQTVPSELVSYVQDAQTQTHDLIKRISKGNFVVVDEHGEALAQADIQKIFQA